MKTGGRKEAANQDPDFAEGAINKEQNALRRGEMSPRLVTLPIALRSCRRGHYRPHMARGKVNAIPEEICNRKRQSLQCAVIHFTRQAEKLFGLKTQHIKLRSSTYSVVF
jgi:hypothetical protein